MTFGEPESVALTPKETILIANLGLDPSLNRMQLLEVHNTFNSADIDPTQHYPRSAFSDMQLVERRRTLLFTSSMCATLEDPQNVFPFIEYKCKTKFNPSVYFYRYFYHGSATQSPPKYRVIRMYRVRAESTVCGYYPYLAVAQRVFRNPGRASDVGARCAMFYIYSRNLYGYRRTPITLNEQLLASIGVESLAVKGVYDRIILDKEVPLRASLPLIRKVMKDLNFQPGDVYNPDSRDPHPKQWLSQSLTACPVRGYRFKWVDPVNNSGETSAGFIRMEPLDTFLRQGYVMPEWTTTDVTQLDVRPISGELYLVLKVIGRNASTTEFQSWVARDSGSTEFTEYFSYPKGEPTDTQWFPAYLPLASADTIWLSTILGLEHISSPLALRYRMVKQPNKINDLGILHLQAASSLVSAVPPRRKSSTTVAPYISVPATASEVRGVVCTVRALVTIANCGTKGYHARACASLTEITAKFAATGPLPPPPVTAPTPTAPPPVTALTPTAPPPVTVAGFLCLPKEIATSIHRLIATLSASVATADTADPDTAPDTADPDTAAPDADDSSSSSSSSEPSDDSSSHFESRSPSPSEYSFDSGANSRADREGPLVPPFLAIHNEDEDAAAAAADAEAPFEATPSGFGFSASNLVEVEEEDLPTLEEMEEVEQSGFEYVSDEEATECTQLRWSKPYLFNYEDLLSKIARPKRKPEEEKAGGSGESAAKKAKKPISVSDTLIRIQRNLPCLVSTLNSWCGLTLQTRHSTISAIKLFKKNWSRYQPTSVLPPTREQYLLIRKMFVKIKLCADQMQKRVARQIHLANLVIEAVDEHTSSGSSSADLAPAPQPGPAPQPELSELEPGPQAFKAVGSELSEPGPEMSELGPEMSDLEDAN